MSRVLSDEEIYLAVKWKPASFEGRIIAKAQQESSDKEWIEWAERQYFIPQEVIQWLKRREDSNEECRQRCYPLGWRSIDGNISLPALVGRGCSSLRFKTENL